MTIHSSILAWSIPWTEKPGRLQSMGSQRVRHNWATNTHSVYKCQSRSPNTSFPSWYPYVCLPRQFMRFTINTVLMKQSGFLRTHAADCCFLTAPVPPWCALHPACFLSSRLSLTRRCPFFALPLEMQTLPKGFPGQEVTHWVGAKLVMISYLEEILGTQTLSLRNHECFCCQKRVRAVWWLTFHDLRHQGLHAIHSLGEYLSGTFYMTVTVSGLSIPSWISSICPSRTGDLVADATCI